MDDATTMISPCDDAAPPNVEPRVAGGGGWQHGGTALVMVASVIAYGVMASGCTGV